MLPLLRNPLRRTHRLHLRFNSTTTTTSPSGLTQKQQETLQYLHETPWRTKRLPLREGATEEEIKAYHREGKLRNRHFSLWRTNPVTAHVTWVTVWEEGKRVVAKLWETERTGKKPPRVEPRKRLWDTERTGKRPPRGESTKRPENPTRNSKGKMGEKEGKGPRQQPHKRSSPEVSRPNNGFQARLEKAEAQNKALTERLSALESQLHSTLSPSAFSNKTPAQLSANADLASVLAKTMKQVQEGLSRTQDLLLKINQSTNLSNSPKPKPQLPRNKPTTPTTQKDTGAKSPSKNPNPRSKPPTKTFSSIFAAAAAASKHHLKHPRPFPSLISTPPRSQKASKPDSIHTKDANGRAPVEETGLLFDTVRVPGRVWDTVYSRRKKPRTWHTNPTKSEVAGVRRRWNAGGGKG